MIFERLLCNHLYLAESHLPRQAEASAEHLLLGTDEPHIMNGKLHLLVTATSNTVINGNLVPNTLRDSLTDIDMVIHLIIRVPRETVDMDHGQFLLSVWRKESILAAVHPREGIEELNSIRGEVHNI